jgi:hypothetical protein
MGPGLGFHRVNARVAVRGKMRTRKFAATLGVVHRYHISRSGHAFRSYDSAIARATYWGELRAGSMITRPLDSSPSATASCGAEREGSRWAWRKASTW